MYTLRVFFIPTWDHGVTFTTKTNYPGTVIGNYPSGGLIADAIGEFK